jgi:rRNA maturation protein Rpf1
LNKTVHKLKINLKPDFFLIGISSHENDYRITWAINNSLGINLVKADNLTTTNDHLKVEQEFAVFEFDDHEGSAKYRLISNRCNNGFLLNEHKNIDFFLAVYGEMNSGSIENMVVLLRKISIITTAFVIQKISAKSAEKFT